MVRRVWFVPVLAVAAFAAPVFGQALGTGFTFQAELREAGTPAAGLHDFRFRLYDLAGAQIGAAQCANDVPVNDGRFSLTLDFGQQFAGSRRFIEIDVRADTGLACTNSAGFRTLVPRQELTATPYAIYALNAGAASNAASLNGQPPSFYTNAANLATGVLPGARLSGTYSGTVTFSNTLNSFAGSGGGLTGLNASNLASGTINTARLPIPLVLAGSDAGGIIRSDNASVAAGSSGLRGAATAPTGTTYGVHGTSAGNAGRGLFGLASSGTGTTYGVYGQSATASTGYGVYGLASAPTGFNIGVGGEAVSPVGVGVFGAATDATGTNYGVYGLSSGASGFGVYGETRGASGIAVFGRTQHATGATIAGWFESSSTAGRGVVGAATASTGATYGVRGIAASSGGSGIYGENTSASGVVSGVVGRSANATGYGVQGFCDPAAGGGIGVYGHILGAGRGVHGFAGFVGSGLGDRVVNYGVYGETSSFNGRGVYGVATNGDPIGSSYGGYFLGGNTGVFGRGTAFGGRFENTGIQGVPLLATTTDGAYALQAQSSAPGGTTIFADSTAANFAIGVHGRIGGSDGYAVYGESTSSLGNAVGVRGSTNAASGVGVRGTSYSTTGTNYGGYFLSYSGGGYGVFGQCLGAPGTTYGVFGQISSGSGFAVFANGSMGASGTKPFRIDHPDDPEHKYLMHYAAESPEVINFYRGTVELDGAGGAVVLLPPYFAKINTHPSYQLTAVGAAMPMLHVAEEIDEALLSAGADAGPGEAAPVCSFRIAGGVSGAKVSWRVEAVRSDRWVRAHGAPVEVDKQGAEQGTYQHPELYGQPVEKGMSHDAMRVHSARAAR